MCRWVPSCGTHSVTTPTTTLSIPADRSISSSTSKPQPNSLASSSWAVTSISTYCFNQLNGTFIPDFPLSILELLQEPQVVLKHQADVVDAVFQHGDALDADAEGKAGIDLRVDAAVCQHVMMHDAAAEDFDPAGVLAQRAALAAAFKTGNVHLHAGLGEGEVGRAQAGLDAL